MNDWCPHCPGDAYWGHGAYCLVARQQRAKVLRYGLLIGALIALFCLLALWPSKAEAGGCYRPFYKPTYSYSSYYYPTYVPYVLEVQVIKDRYYSLSDLYRDRLYLEQYDLLKEMRARLTQGEQPYIPPTTPNPATPNPQTRTTPQPGFGLPSVTVKAEAVLVKNCQGCHTSGKAQAKLDLTDLSKLTSTQRWAMFGMAAAGDMPPPPAELLATGKEKDLNDWKKLYALKEEDMQLLYPWTQLAKGK